jgi:hypothetical protein
MQIILIVIKIMAIKRIKAYNIIYELNEINGKDIS